MRIALICKVDDLSTEGWAERRDLLKSERTSRALRMFGIFFGVAFLTIFVPVLHFILPPVMLIVGGVLAVNEYSATGEVVEGEMICPNCKKLMTLPRESEEWPLTKRCQGCSFTLTVDRA